MKTTTKTALLLATSLFALPVAKAYADTTPGWYTGLGAGMNFQDRTNDDTHGEISHKFDKPGFDVLGDAGYEWENGFRAEGEVFHSHAVIKGGDGSLGNTDLFANGLYDFNLNSTFTPYVGAGVGADFTDADNIGPMGGAGAPHIRDSDTKFAYQGIAGVSARLTDKWSVSADYRYIASLDPKYTNTVGVKDKIDNASHNIIFGVRYNLDSTAPASAMSTTAPSTGHMTATKPMVAPVPQTFEVFFDYNKSNLTPEAKRIITSAAQEYKKGGYVRISVIGHTDTKGTDAYNMKLSKRRAAAVKSEFARLGVQSSVISAEGVGKEGLLVPTNDQVREAQNRRAEIVLGKQ